MDVNKARQALSGWLRWRQGRQGTGYAKLLLATSPWPIGFDLYLLRYREGQGIHTHTDPVPGKAHWRLNIILWQSGKGGQFQCDPPGPYWKSWRTVLFRPDLSPHRVTPVETGSRYVLSLGWVR